MVEKELKKLEKEKYISTDVCQQVVKAHEKYYKELEHREKEERNARLSKNTSALKKNKKLNQSSPVPFAKKQLSPQQIRERNIIWSLNIGIILLLLGGLVLATSTWDTLNSLMKVVLITFVSVLFYGLAYVTERMLKIEKTAFAFYVLGSLFLPIVILSIGFFKLWGNYFSVFGEGKFLFGAAGSLIILPVYVFFAQKLRARLFVWFACASLTLAAGFLLAACKPPLDVFYFGMMLFNGLLMVLYRYLKKNDAWQLFSKECLLYVQVNMIFSTLLMLGFYEREVAHGFNLILTAILYFAMVYVSKHREYQFVFTAMLVYGVYQIIEFSALVHVGAAVYALLGFVFIVLPLLLKGDDKQKRIYHYTSALVSGCAFLYISFQGLVWLHDQPSIVFLAAYVIIFLNYAYLSHSVKRVLFSYLAPVFLLAALREAVLLGHTWFGYESITLIMFFASLLVYILFGCLMKLPLFQSLKESSRDIAGAAALICLIADLIVFNWWQAGMMMLCLSLTAAFVAAKFEIRTWIPEINLPALFHAILLAMSVCLFYGAWADRSMPYHHDGPLEAPGAAIASFLTLLASILWQRRNNRLFADYCFYTSEIFYLFAIAGTLTWGFSPSLRVSIVSGGIVMAYLLYRKTKSRTASFAAGSTSLLFYLTTIYLMDVDLYIQSEMWQELRFLLGAVLLLAVGMALAKWDDVLARAFWWTGHIYLPLALLGSLLEHGDKSFWVFGIAVLIYAISTVRVSEEWRIKTFLYATFVSFWVMLSLGFIFLGWYDTLHYTWLITSATAATVWFIARQPWTKRIAYLVVPFSVFGMLDFVMAQPFGLLLLIITAIYASGLLFILHAEEWDMFAFIPLAFVLYAINVYSEAYPEQEYGLLVMFLAAVTLAGQSLYKNIYTNIDRKVLRVDWYTIAGLMPLIQLNFQTGESLWVRLLPGLFVATFIFLQRNRVPDIKPKWVIFASIAYLLQPFYALLDRLDIPPLFEMECYVLPWVLLSVILQKTAGRKNRQITSYIQWTILVIVSLLLIQDGLDGGTVYDALVIGSLSLASMLGGMAYKMKSFFFVGSGVLLLNVFLQTRPFWGNMPWWGYLLIGGSLLIAVASYNEWHKQKSAEGRETLLSKCRRYLIQKFKEWQ
ncbi:hypothetical protein [Virgibacillus halophilus]|uniref:hypothetical protein n=1 Tax=Tigheibacillus halophilus TaxID=361280 RepID=UPI0036F26046